MTEHNNRQTGTLSGIARAIPAGMALLLLSACAQLQQRAPEPERQQRIQIPAPEQAQQEEPEPAQPPLSATPGEEPLDITGSGIFIRPLPAVAEASQDDTGDGVSLNFVDSEIAEFIKIVLGDLLNLNYSIDGKVSGKVTIQTASNIPKEELLTLFEEVLAMHGAALDKRGNIHYVTQRGKATSIRSTGFGLTVIPLRYIAAPEMQELLVPITPSTSSVQVNHLRNLLLVSGSTPEVETMKEMISLFDVDWLKGMSVSLHPLRYVDAARAKQEMDDIYSALAAGRKESALLRVVPIERIRALLLVSTNAERIRQAQQWLRQLDKPSEQSGQQLYVYKVQNAKAVELADVLNQIFASRKKETSQQQPRETTTLAPQAVPQTIETDAAAQEEIPPETQPPPQPSAPQTSTGVALPTTSNIEIIADDTRNSLVILATASDYAMIEAAIKKLDVIPLQVLIEAQIMEVTLEDKLTYGVEWLIRHSIGNSRTGNIGLDLGDAGIAAQAPALSYTIVGSSGRVRFALNALASQMEIRLLSSPSLMVLDNQTARIVVGDEIPIPKRQSISNVNPDAPTVNEIEFRNTGVSLTVTPRVTDGGLVTIDIEQEVSNATSTDSSGIDAPTIQKRSIKSTIAVQNDDTIVLGGLISDRGTDSDAGVPIAKDIPIIGNLFRRESTEDRRTELIVLLTPRVVHDRGRAYQLTEEFSNKLQDLNRIMSEEQ